MTIQTSEKISSTGAVIVSTFLEDNSLDAKMFLSDVYIKSTRAKKYQAEELLYSRKTLDVE